MKQDLAEAMAEVVETASVLASCNLIDLQFSSGHNLEVYLAITDQQRSKGLSCLSYLDSSGMLFHYPETSTVAFSMANTFLDLDISWYNSKGQLIQSGTYRKGDRTPLICAEPFSFVLETPVGILPSGDFQIKRI